MQKKCITFTLFFFTSLLKGATAEPKSNKLINALTAQPTQTTSAEIKPSSPKRTITIKNTIEPKMLTYKHWSGNKVPDPFKIVIDGKEIAPGKSITVAIENDTLPVQFSYSFMMGYKKGTNEVTFQVPEHKDNLNLTFSWDNDYRVILEHAKAIKKQAVLSQS
ncbi:MAG: hypothetical protein AB7F19_01920 [Candidatus Babeliales bacterium]